MPIPPDNRAPGDAGHVADHNNVADALVTLTAGVAASAQTANNLFDLTSPATALANIGGLPKAGGTMSGPIAMGGSKVTGAGNASASGDLVPYGQLGSAAFQAASAFDAAGAASAAQSNAETYASGLVTGLGEFSVAAYAGGDSTGATDSSSAVAAAQAAAVAAGGGYVTFGPGTWMFSTVNIAGATGTIYTRPPLVHFRFAGIGSTVLTPLNANSPLFQAHSGQYPAGVRFEGGFTVKAHASGSAGPAIDLTSARQWVIESPAYLDSLEGAAGTPGTYAQVIGFGVNTYACRIVDPICEGQRLGACFAGSISNTLVVANGNAIENPLFEGCTAPYMIDAAGTLSLSVDDGISEGNTVTAQIRLGKHTRVSHCYFEEGTATGPAYTMNAAGVDGYYPPGSPGSDIAYDPGGCLLEFNEYYSGAGTLTIPSGVTPGTMVIGTLNNLSITDNTQTLLLNFQQAAGSTTYLNNASGGANGTTVTTGNSGGGSGTAFSAVSGSPTFTNAAAYPPSALAYSLVTSASNESLRWTLPSSITAGQTIYLREYVYFPGSVFTTVLMSTLGLWYECGVNSSSQFYVRADPGSVVTSVTVSPATWYRLELQANFSAGTAILNIYDQYGNLLATVTGTGGTENSANGSVYFGAYSLTSTGTVYLANLGLSNGTWLGPAISGVASVVAGDTSIVVGGTLQAPTVETGTLDLIAAAHPPAANWSNNSKKITSLANGSGPQDAAAFGQIPAALPPNGTAGGALTGSYPNPGLATVTIAEGGTGQTGQQAAINALTGTQSAGKVLRSDGTNATLSAIQAGDLPAATTGAQGAVQLDGTAGDIKAPGAQSAGSTGKAADAGHIHPSSPVASQTLATAAASITFSSIPAGYSLLRLLVVGASASATESDRWLVTVNGTGGTSYDLYGTSNRNAYSSWVPSVGNPPGDMPAASATSGVAGILDIQIPLYAGTVFQKVGTWRSGYSDDATSSADQGIQTSIVAWRSTAAISSMSIASATGSNLVAGTTAYLFLS